MIVFLSDNGGPTGRGQGANNWPLRGSKVKAFLQKSKFCKKGNVLMHREVCGREVRGQLPSCTRCFLLLILPPELPPSSLSTAGCAGSSQRARLDACDRLAANPG